MTHVSNAVRPVLPGQAAMPITPYSVPNKTIFTAKTMYCDVVFGSPSMDCNGTGICKITGTHSVQKIQWKPTCQRTRGQIAALPNGKVSLYFFREFLCIELYRQHFRKGILVLKEPCEIPSDIAATLGLQGEKLLPGHYSVVESDGLFRVDLNLSGAHL